MLYVDIGTGNTPRAYGGPITHFISVSHSWLVDRMGRFSFSIPAAHPHRTLIEPLRYARIYDSGTLVGGGVIRSRNITKSGQNAAILEVSGDDLLHEVQRISVENLQLDSVNTGPTNIVGYASASVLPGAWGIGSATTAVNVSYQFRHQNVLEALSTLVDLTGEHFVLDFGPFSRTIDWLGPASGFAASGITATNRTDPLHIHRNADRCLVTDITQNTEAAETVNRVFAFGGNGVTLSNATQWPDGTTYVGGTNTITMSDGRDYTVNLGNSWFQDDDSITDLGSEFHQRIDRSDIVPIAVGAAYDQAASNELWRAAWHHIRTRIAQQAFHTLTVTGLDQTLSPGTTIDVDVREFDKNGETISITGTLNVMGVTVNYDARGNKTHQIEVASTDRIAQSDATLVRRQARQIQTLARA